MKVNSTFSWRLTRANQSITDSRCLDLRNLDGLKSSALNVHSFDRSFKGCPWMGLLRAAQKQTTYRLLSLLH